MITMPNDFKVTDDCLKDKVIMVSGATGGFGRMICERYAALGATVILLGKNIRALEALYDDIEKQGGPTPAIYPINLEGATEKDYAEMAENIDQEFGRLDGMVHCAAQLGAPTPFEHSDTENWYKVMQVNLHAPYLMSKYCLPLMRQSQHASMIFVTDERAGAYWDAYTVTKAGLDALMQNLAAEFDGSQIYVNSVRPAPCKTLLQIRAFPAAENDKLPEPAVYGDLFVYLMSDSLNQSGGIYTG